MVSLPYRQAITWEYGFLHFSARCVAGLATNFCASLPNSPSVVVTKGVKFLLLSQQGCKLFFFFSFSCFSSIFSTVELRFEFASGQVIWISMIHLFCPESSDSNVALVLSVRHLCRICTILDRWFDLNCTRRESLTCQQCQRVSQLIVGLRN